MFGTKIRNWMEAHIPRSKKKDRASSSKALSGASLEGSFRFFDAKFFGARDDFNEILPTLPLTSSSFKPQRPVAHHNIQDEPVRRRQPPVGQSQQTQRYPEQQQQQQTDKQPRNSAVTLSSPESAYSTGYSTDGTSPCATYAPEYYNVVRTVRNGGQVQQYKPNAPVLVDTTTQTRVAGRRGDDGVKRIENTGTYAVSRPRYTDYQQQQPWRKPTPPTPSRPLGGSPKIQVGSGPLMRKPYSTPAVAATSDSSYPLQLFSPRRLPLVATTSTQVTPASPRLLELQQQQQQQRPRVRTNPWLVQQQQQVVQQQPTWQQPPNEYWRQESLSVGRSPVNRGASEWRRRSRLRSKTRSTASSSSSTSSRSSHRSRSCSLSSTASSSSSSSPACSSDDDVTLNEVIGKFDENYLYDKETDIVSDRSEPGGCTTGGSGIDNSSFSVNFSSDASLSSLELQLDGGRRSSTSRSSSRPLSGRRQRRRRHHRRSVGSSSRDEEEHREEVELLQVVLNRRLKKQNSEASAQTNRALLERMLMKNTAAGSGYEGVGAARRAWSANPHHRPAASRSLGGTPLCLRRKTAPRNLMPSRLAFERNNQVFPADSTSSLKNMSASELALIEADKEADLKYTQLIMEAERMLLNAQEQLQREESTNNSRRGSVSSAAPESSPSRFPRRPYPQQQCASAPNKRVELLKNAELNIELALSKSRNSQPELSSGSIKELFDHSSPKRLLQQQQKKMIAQQAVASTQTTGSYLKDFQSIDPKSVPVSDLNAAAENYSCPQSEPVKRKVYEGQDGGRLLQRQPPPWLRNSDGDCTQDQPQSQLQSASAASSYAQLRKHMLIETLQGLKQSLEDQSAALSKLNCLRPV